MDDATAKLVLGELLKLCSNHAHAKGYRCRKCEAVRHAIDAIEDRAGLVKAVQELTPASSPARDLAAAADRRMKGE